MTDEGMLDKLLKHPLKKHSNNVLIGNDQIKIAYPIELIQNGMTPKDSLKAA